MRFKDTYAVRTIAPVPLVLAPKGAQHARLWSTTQADLRGKSQTLQNTPVNLKVCKVCNLRHSAPFQRFSITDFRLQNDALGLIIAADTIHYDLRRLPADFQSAGIHGCNFFG